jgi:lipoyl(octanoyl) transferase
VLIDEAERQRRGIDYEETGRGGDVTYHGPGQLVGYPIIALQPGERDIKRYVTALEELLIRVAQDFAITAERVEGLRGIWVGHDKLAAIGIRFVRWTTLHGFALNVSTRLSDFAAIVPCGLHDRGVTSMAALGAGTLTLEQVAERVVAHAGETLARTPQRHQIPLPGSRND